MSYAKGNKQDGKHYWLTPPDLYAKLDAEFHFDFDPCPYPRPDGFDGLTCEWGQSNYVNPPFDHARAWAEKCAAEAAKGKTVVYLMQAFDSAYVMVDAGAITRAVGRVPWLATEDGSRKAKDKEYWNTIAFILRGNHA